MNERQLIIQSTTKQELIQELANYLESKQEQKKLVKEVLYIPDVASRLKRSVNHVRNLIKNKKIKFLQEKKGSVIMFYESHIEDYPKTLKTVSSEEEEREVSAFINNPLSHGNSRSK